MVEASVRELALRYQARVDVLSFERLFEAQEQDGKLKLLKGFESFVEGLPSGRAEVQRERLERIRIRQQEALLEELSAQESRLLRAREGLLRKETRTLLNEVRIAGNKVRQLREKLSDLEIPPGGGERIFPGVFAPLIVFEAGERWIRPFRYQLRPAGEPETFDRKFNGTYNIRKDRLGDVRWWRELYGKRHGILVMKRFYEHVQSEDGDSAVLEFLEEPEQDLLVPCLHDRNEEGSSPLDSFGLITDDPNPEVLAAGHDRTPVVIHPESMGAWLDTGAVRSSGYFDLILTQKRSTRFLNRRIDIRDRS